MLIGISGKKGCGKDTVSDYICEKYKFIKLDFAGPLKECCKNIFNFDNEQLYGNNKEVVDEFWGVTPREIMQYLGTDLFRYSLKNKFPNIGENIWVMLMENKIKKLKNTNIIISDVRFVNEFDMIKKLGGVVIRVDRNQDKNEKFKDHISENNLFNFDNLLYNNSTIDDLHKKIDDLFVILC